MNYKHSFAFLILISSTSIIGCAENKPGQSEQIAAASTLSLTEDDEHAYKIDSKATEVIWKGSSIQGAHDGYAYVSKGELMIDNSQLKGGTIEMDMNKTEGPGHDKSNNLIDHLKGPDFFDVQKFPFSTFTITGVETLNGDNKKVTGDLKIKGITHPVSFPASVQINNGVVNASAKLVIDRTQWDIKYKSGKFFDNLKDQAIADSIEFRIKIVATK